MIELQRVDEKFAQEYFLRINGEVISEATGFSEALPEVFEIREEGEKLIEMCCFSDLPPNIAHIRLATVYYIPPVNFGREIYSNNDGQYAIALRVTPVAGEWTFPFSPNAFMKEIQSLIPEQFVGVSIENVGTVGWPLRLIFAVDDSENNIGREISKDVDTLNEILERCLSSCTERSKSAILATYFSFPEEIKSACEQYLLYFGEFLRDLGINASIEIKEQSNRVLFSVTPSDKSEAIDRIRQVLEFYLNLPAATFTSAEENEYRIEVQRLSANIMHLRSQLMLAQAILESKNATIEAQKDRLIYRGELLEGRLLNEGEGKPASDKEELFQGTLAIKKYEGKGFDVNLPKMYRYLRDWIKGDRPANRKD